MAYLNDNYLKLRPAISSRGRTPRRRILPREPRRRQAVDSLRHRRRNGTLPPAVIAAMHHAVDELSVRETFGATAMSRATNFLRRKSRNRITAIAKSRSQPMRYSSPTDQNRTAGTSSIFLGIKTGSRSRSRYPVYVDTNVMAGHTGVAGEAGRFEGITYLPCGPENDFVPSNRASRSISSTSVFPTTRRWVASRAQLTRWVEYALEHEASSSSMPPMKRTSAIRKSRIRSTKFRALTNAPLSSAVFPRTAVSRCAMRLHGHAEKPEGAHLRRPEAPASSFLASGAGAQKQMA